MKLLHSDDAMWNGVGLWVDLVRVPPSGTSERRRADPYALADDWVGTPAVTPEDGFDHLVRRYLGGFGPAPLRDVANWAGLPTSMLLPSIERLASSAGFATRTAPCCTISRGLRSRILTFPARVRFLPTWDAALLVHARRTHILPEQYRGQVFPTKTPQSGSTFLVDGSVAGTWRQERGRVIVEPFARLPRERAPRARRGGRSAGRRSCLTVPHRCERRQEAEATARQGTAASRRT